MNKFILPPLAILLFSFWSVNAVAAENTKEIKPSLEQVKQAIIDLNNADVTQLSTLKGIGAKRAQAIIDYRNTHGKFTSLEQLMEVKGVGSGFLQSNKGLIKI